jgi:hypothetical protein
MTCTENSGKLATHNLVLLIASLILMIFTCKSTLLQTPIDFVFFKLFNFLES